MSTKNLNFTLSLFRFRISCPNLRIETGRYNRPKTSENKRICLYCSMQAVENEAHFILDCNLYSQEWEELLNNVYKYIPNYRYFTKEEKFITLLSSKIRPITDALANICTDVLKREVNLK